MKYSEFLFIDFENVQTFDIHSLNDGIKVYIFVGNQQKKIPFDLVASAQKRGESIEWIQVSAQGKNALDFHIAFYLGELNQTTAKGLKFTVLSKDTGYDPLVQHLSRLGRQCRRINSFREIANYAKEEAEDPDTQRVITNLAKINKSKRPRTRNTLSKHIMTVLRGEATAEKVIGIVDNLFVMKKASERNGRLIYNL
ncbi:MAG: PIN domain-containing protein [Dehalococcoidia bacterium]|nr:hypothetical protein [Chloroflexota bacterium]MBT9159545.1 hypothetical protein [Chloroflexota bacterium]MBT9161812.1 hypothetical protein [Chloroflexota bacterium]